MKIKAIKSSILLIGEDINRIDFNHDAEIFLITNH
jgi:hypothetical protein